MRKEHTISAHIDRWEKSSTEISVTGWAYSVTGNCEIHVLDGNQREIPAIVRRSRRIDIDRLFSITERQDTGFIQTCISLKNTECRKQGTGLL